MSSSNKKHKVVVFDVDETLGNFAQFSIFGHVLDDYFNQHDIIYRYFNDLVDLYPEIIRPKMVRILDYIRKKKNAGICSKVMIYTNNMAPDKWVTHIRRYFEFKLKHIVAENEKDIAIVPPLFDHLIGGFKPNQPYSTSGHPQRTTKEKTIDDFIHCSRLPVNIDICFLDDVYHSKMTDERVYYIKLQPFYSYISFETFVVRFLNSSLFRDVFDKIDVSSITPSMSSAVKKQIISIELHDMFIKYANIANYDAKSYQRKMNPREIDEIISKYIIYHLQQFFRDGPPRLNSSEQSIKNLNKRSRLSKTAKKKGHLTHHPNNVFYVDKTTAVKNMHNKTIRNR